MTYAWAMTLWLCGTTVACGSALEEPSISPEPILTEQSVALENGTKDVVLESNTIHGQVHFTNQNPEILHLLDTDTNRSGLVTATSTSPTGFTARAELPAQPNLRGFSFELAVEAGAGGSGGVTYEVLPRWVWNLPADYRLYTFTKAQGVQVRPRSEQPLPTELDFSECLGAIEFRFGTDETCSTPLSVGQVMFAGQLLATHPNGSFVYYVKGGSSGTATPLVYWLGTNPALDWRAFHKTINWSASCDELIKVCVPDPGPGQIGSLTGPWDIIGEPSLTYQSIPLLDGPDGNVRFHYLAIPQDARAPVSDPSRWWTLPNIVPGDYATLRGTGYARRGREFTVFQTRSVGPTSVVAGPSVPLTKEINGETRYPFVMHPAYLYGSLRLADPYVTAHPGAYSSLQALSFEADYDSNGDGLPNNVDLYAGARYSTQLRAVGTNTALSATAFPGSFSPSTGELSSSYEQLLTYIYDEPHPWQQDLLRLGFWTQGYDFITRPGQYDPARFRYGYLDLKQKQNTPPAPLQPGERFRVDHAYCFNEVQLEFSTTDTPFINPTATLSGSFQGTDWRGLAADYTVSGLASGIPAAVGLPQTQAIPYAQKHGSVSFTLPQGSYTVTPGATLVNSNGGTSQTTFQPLQLTLGCGQRLTLVPPLTVAITPQPTCASGLSQTVTGVVKSRPAEVDRVWYQLNGGPEVTLCENCGIDPAFSIPVQLQACGNTVQVFAFTAGMTEPATGSQELVWDDPADGPSCGEAACVNQPPVARCANQVVAANGACAACVSVNDGSYDPDGEEVSCVQTPDCSYGLGQNRVTLMCTDARGKSDSCQATVTVRDATPPSLTCGQPPELECAAGGAVASYAPSATDNCGAAPSVTCTPASGSHFAPGTTMVTCEATDATGNQASCSFPVKVTEGSGPPSLVLNGDSELTLECGQDVYVDLGAVATAGCGDALEVHRYNSGQDPYGPGPDASAEGTYSVQYVAWDSNWHTVGAIRTVHVEDRTPPSLTLRGPSHMVHTCGTAWVDPGVEAVDACYGDLSPAVSRTGDVNGWVAGQYTLRYAVTDSGGNTATPVQRTVEVVDCPW